MKLLGYSDASHGVRRNRRAKIDISFCGMEPPSHGIPEGRSPSQSPLIRQKFMDSVKPLGKPSG